MKQLIEYKWERVSDYEENISERKRFPHSYLFL